MPVLSAIPLIQRNNKSQVGQDNAAAGSVSLSEPSDGNMEEPQGCLNKPPGPLTLSERLGVGGKFSSVLNNANQFQGLFD